VLPRTKNPVAACDFCDSLLPQNSRGSFVLAQQKILRNEYFGERRLTSMFTQSGPSALAGNQSPIS